MMTTNPQHDTLNETMKRIAVITAPHGLKGEVVMKPFDPDAPWAADIEEVYLFLPKGAQVAVLGEMRWQGDRIIAAINGVTSREGAQALVGADVRALTSDLPELEDDEYYCDNLLGLTVVSQASNEVLGTVTEVLSSEAGDFLEVSSPILTEPVLIPFQQVFVPVVDMAARRIEITGLDSLFSSADVEETPSG